MIIINSYYLNTMNSKCQCHRDSVTQLEVLESTRLALVQSPLSRQCHRTVTDSRSRYSLELENTSRSARL